jgi:hypothetical protein
MRFAFEELEAADLVRGAIYEQGYDGTIAGEPISRLTYAGNAGGFRMLGGKTVPGATLVVLYSTGTVGEWPDEQQHASGRFVYFGDNRDADRSPSDALEAVHPGGNRLLRQTFDALRRPDRPSIPPFLIFRKVEEQKRDVEFVGLAAPGAPGTTEEEELVAFWRRNDQGRRFINYRAVFTLLDVDRVGRSWLRRIRDQRKWLEGCPSAWSRFVDSNEYVTVLHGSS